MKKFVLFICAALIIEFASGYTYDKREENGADGALNGKDGGNDDETREVKTVENKDLEDYNKGKNGDDRKVGKRDTETGLEGKNSEADERMLLGLLSKICKKRSMGFETSDEMI